MRPKGLVKPALAALLFVALSLFFTYYFTASLQNLGIGIGREAELFISSPFNMSTEGDLLYNLYIPAAIIFALGVYLKNFNSAFQRKANLRSIFLLSIAASYVKSLLSMQYYAGYSDFGISMGTSIITLSFIVAFVISLEVYVERKERYEHLYGHFMLAVLSSLILLLGALTVFSLFFTTNSYIVHAMGISAFLLMFVPWYERANIRRLVRREERALAGAVGGRPSRA